MNDKAATQCSARPGLLSVQKFISAKSLSRVKDGDKFCAGVEVVALQVGQLLVRVRLHLLVTVDDEKEKKKTSWRLKSSCL